MPDLHLPGVIRLAPLDALLAQQSAWQFDAVVPYTAPSSNGTLHLLALLGTPLYDVDLDEAQSPRLLEGDFPCTAPIAVSQDSAWAACATGEGTSEGIGMFALPSEGGPAPQVRLVLPNPRSDEVFYSPTWGPDGRSLAVLRHGPGKPDAIVVYAVPPTHDTVRLTSVLNLSGSLVPVSLSWSPDGRWLSVSGRRSPTDRPTYLLPARMLPIAQPSGDGPPATGTLNIEQMGDISLQIPVVLGWRPSDGAFTFVRDRSIVTRDLASGNETTLLTVPGGYICALAWAPDGRRLFFQLCSNATLGAVPYPAKMYLFTSPGG